MTKQIRRISQILFLALFLYFVFALACYTKPVASWFVRVDPLVVGATALAVRKLTLDALLALIVVIPTLFLGRVFCGWVCPLGTVLDLGDKVFYRTKRPKNPVEYRRLKYYILAGLAVTALFSMQAIYMLDPLCLLTRTIDLAFIAPVQFFLRSTQDLLNTLSGSSFGPLASVSLWLSSKMGGWSFIAGDQMFYRQSFLFLAIFVGIVGLNSISRRFWCRNLCPLGALLGLFSRLPVLKRVVADDCIECGKCIRDCKMRAIPSDPHVTRSSECIECFDCVPICPKKAESFRARPKPESRPEAGLDLSRRRVLQGAGIGLAFAALTRVDPAAKYARNAVNIKLSSPGLIRPPGAVAEHEFVNLCVRCGACMKACPSSGLQPALHEAGIEGFWTPILVPNIGPCVQECNACGRVCPTKAIRSVTVAEKSHIIIGTASIEHDHCLAWYGRRECLVCNEHCSYQAVDLRVVEGVNRPFVNEDKCTGCGACENACPIQPVAAIRVSSRGDMRG
jgi:polyferredoxin